MHSFCQTSKLGLCRLRASIHENCFHVLHSDSQNFPFLLVDHICVIRLHHLLIVLIYSYLLLIRSASLPGTSATQEFDLVGTICQKLDDLQSKHNVIKRDGTIVPIRKLDTSRPKPAQEGKGDRVTLFSEPDFSPNPIPLVECNVAKSPEIQDDILVCCSSQSSSDVIQHRTLSDMKRSKSTISHRAFSALNKSVSGSVSLSCNENIPIGVEHSPDSSTTAIDCLDSHPVQTNPSFRQARVELSFKHSCNRAAESTSPVELVKQCLYTHYINRTITDREYHRIVERATKKVSAYSLM